MTEATIKKYNLSIAVTSLVLSITLMMLTDNAYIDTALTTMLFLSVFYMIYTIIYTGQIGLLFLITAAHVIVLIVITIPQ